jgi:hypothetical protein
LAAAEVVWRVDLGAEDDAAVAAYGWSAPGEVRQRSVRWVDGMEADLVVSLAQPADLELVIEAAQEPVHWRRHQLGVYVNNRFVVALRSPNHGQYHVYRTTVPAAFWRDGENRLTLRMAYRIRIGEPEYRFGFAVDQVFLQRP